MRYYAILKLISTVNNLANDNTKKIRLLIIYNANGYPISLSNWEDEHYFIRGFSTQFLFEDDKYLAKHKTGILL